MSTLRIKGKADLVDKVMGRLQASRPKDKDCTYEISRSSTAILSKIKYVLTTGIDAIDHTIGGFPFGRVVEVCGLEGCVSRDTFIHYCITDKTGKIQNSKGGTIERLWHRFHGKTLKGPGNYVHPQTIGSDFYVPSINSEGRIFRNRVADVVKTGTKTCYLVETGMGYKITATPDHRFYTGTEYVELSRLSIGSTVMIHNGTPYSTDDGRERGGYPAVSVKYYYKGTPKAVDKYRYYIVRLHRFTYEAAMNGLTACQYKKLLDSGITALPDGFWTIPDGFDIHHRDENKQNYALENLELVEAASHIRHHALKDHNNLRFMAVQDTVLSIKPVGEVETYDIKCFAPHNNYVASNFVVHNCGKTALVMRAAARTQQRMIYEKKDDGTWAKVPDDAEVAILYIDNEQSIDDDQRLIIDGVKVDAIIGRCDTVDQMFKMIDVTLDTIDAEMTPKDKDAEPPLYFVTIIVDTIAGTSSKEEMKAEWGKDDYNRQPKQLRQGFRRMMRKISRRNVLMLCTNQVSDRFDKPKGGYNNSPVPHESDFTSFGGKALKFFASQRIFMSKIGEYKLNKKAKFPHGMLCQLSTPKNRVAKPFRSARFVILFDRGMSNVYSILETLIHMKLAEREAGQVEFKFSAAGIEPASFEFTGRSKKVVLASLDEWPAFYQAHKDDFDKLWARAKILMFEDNSVSQVEDEDDPDLENGVDEDED